MTRPFTVQVGYFVHFANTVTLEAQTLEEALEKAVAAANENPEGWKGTDHVTDTFVDAVCEGADGDPWGEGALPVPDRFTERGEPPVVTLTGPVQPGVVEVSGGKALVRIVGEAGTVPPTSRRAPTLAQGFDSTFAIGCQPQPPHVPLLKNSAFDLMTALGLSLARHRLKGSFLNDSG